MSEPTPDQPSLTAEVRDSALLFALLLFTTFGVAGIASTLMHYAG